MKCDSPVKSALLKFVGIELALQFLQDFLAAGKVLVFSVRGNNCSIGQQGLWGWHQLGWYEGR